MPERRAIAGTLVLAMLAGAAAAQTPDAPPDRARQRELAELVRQDCGSCHGMTLRGGLGSPLLPERLAGYATADLAAIILDGIPGTPMPPWRGLLSAGEAAWIAEQLRKGLSR